MPELPEVAVFKRYFESTALHKTIAKVTVKSTQVLEETAKETLQTKLAKKEFAACQRHGKYLFASVSEEFWLVMHFGMTGNLKYFKAIEEEPTHDRFLVSFQNGYHLAFDNQRKFGKITTTPKVEEFVEKKKLGPDALEVEFDVFRHVLEKSRGSAKYTLMNQHVVAGIGNIYSDEILFQTGVHPKTKISKLKADALKQLYINMRRILKTAIRNQANPQRMPQTYLLPHRSRGGKCPRCGGKIETLKVSGRTAYFCPRCQKKLD